METRDFNFDYNSIYNSEAISEDFVDDTESVEEIAESVEEVCEPTAVTAEIKEDELGSGSAVQGTNPEAQTATPANVLTEEQLQSALQGLEERLSRMVKYEINSANSNADIKDNLLKVIEEQETTIKRQHLTTVKFQEDLYYKIQKPLIMDIIEIADHIRMILQDQEKEKNYDAFVEAVKGLGTWVDATLSNNSVHKYSETEHNPTELNRKRQEIVDTEDTDDIEKNNTYITERPGYTWTMPYLVINSEVQLQKILQENSMPQAFSFVIRPEEVVKLKYRKPEE